MLVFINKESDTYVHFSSKLARYRPCLPDNAIVFTVHRGSHRAIELRSEVRVVGQGAEYSVLAWAMRIGKNLVFQPFWGLKAAPQVGVRKEEYLFGRVLLQAGQLRLGSVGSYVEVVRAESLAQATVVGNVFTLCRHSIDLQSSRLSHAIFTL